MPGSIHEGGELGYSLAHAYGAAFDNPGLIVACVIGDGEAETGPLPRPGIRTSSSTRARDGAVLPILHLNGYKIANPTVLARIPREELDDLLARLRLQPLLTSRATIPRAMHAAHGSDAATRVFDEIARDPAQRARPAARSNARAGR